MLDYKMMNIDDIINWCKENGEVAWLKEQAKNKPSFFVLKKAFVGKFMPEIKPVKKEQEPTMWERIAAL
jgi:hypothetical protein